jgi:hypothetical protein
MRLVGAHQILSPSGIRCEFSEAAGVKIMATRSSEAVSQWAAGAAENYDAFLARLGQKGLAAVEKHAELCEADAAQGYGRWWKRIAGMLGKLAPHAIETAGHQAVKFHIPDGKYRQQVFALEDPGTGMIYVYMPDISAGAVTKKILKAVGPDGRTYAVVGDAEGKVDLEVVTSDAKEVPAFIKPMLGWGRRALKTGVSVTAEEKQVRVVEKLCELAAEGWAGREMPAVATTGGK